MRVPGGMRCLRENDRLWAFRRLLQLLTERRWLSMIPRPRAQQQLQLLPSCCIRHAASCTAAPALPAFLPYMACPCSCTAHTSGRPGTVRRTTARRLVLPWFEAAVWSSQAASPLSPFVQEHKRRSRYYSCPSASECRLPFFQASVHVKGDVLSHTVRSAPPAALPSHHRQKSLDRPQGIPAASIGTG